MSNTYFQCKQFIVHQEHTAMKVCTDACLFGGWLAKAPSILHSGAILDIGTGTGLLSLMVAQANPTANITAIEIEPNAAAQANENFNNSPWKERLHVIANSIQTYTESSTPYSFDCIISNPPFFESDLPSPNDQKNLAQHSTALPWKELIENVNKLLSINGEFFVLIPALRAYTMQKIAGENGLQLAEEVVVYNAEKQKPFRVVQKFVKTKEANITIKRSNFYIKDATNNYTNAFKELLSPYYLHL